MGIKVTVCGAAGKMGRQVLKAVLADADLTLVGAVDKACINLGIDKLIGENPSNLVVIGHLDDALKDGKTDVMVDFTHPSSVMNNIRTALKRKVHVVVGTTGIIADDLAEIESLTQETGVNAFVAPNFALGAVLMMEFSRLAAKYMPQAEIIELHNPEKADAPSGTAIRTSEIISKEIKEEHEPSDRGKESIIGVRGGTENKVYIHSVRLPGLVAHQEVIFGGKSQILTIRHDSTDRSSFMPGVIMAIKKVQSRKGLTHGLDKLLDL